MADDDKRCILVLDDELPRWLAANATAVLGVALGGHGRIPLGPDLPDGTGDVHPGIGTTPLPILTAPARDLPTLRRKAVALGIFVVDFNGAAHQSKTYSQYQDLLGADEPTYLGLGMHGPAKPLRSLTGNLRSLK